jgi:hypothetical protein
MKGVDAAKTAKPSLNFQSTKNANQMAPSVT